MKEIDHCIRMPDQSPAVSLLLIQHLEYNIITDYGYQILIDTVHKIPELESDTNNLLPKLFSVTGYLPYKSEALLIEKYITEVNCLQETTSSGTSYITPEMVNTESLDPEPSEIGWRRFNFLWRTGYSP